jgi:hypothetical protein
VVRRTNGVSIPTAASGSAGKGHRMEVNIETAMISVSDKSWVVEYARKLSTMGVKIISNRRHRQSPTPVGDQGNLDRHRNGFSGDDGLPRQDAAPEDPRGAVGPARHAAQPRSILSAADGICHPRFGPQPARFRRCPQCIVDQADTSTRAYSCHSGKSIETFLSGMRNTNHCRFESYNSRQFGLAICTIK